jgi:TolB-like protein/cytochrome c-type biogenesis protein CcmH/NrfG
MSFINELKRRNVFRVAIAYAIVAWLLLQVSDTLVPALHLPEWFNSGVAFVLIIGFPIAMIFAWAFEMTPEGIKKEKDVDRSQSMTSVTGQKLNNAIIGVLVLALAYFAIDKFILAPGRAQPGSDPFSQRTAGQPTDVSEKRALTPVEADLNSVEATTKAVITNQSIAVLPFVNMSEDGANEYFSDGLSEELLNLLAKIPELKVAARTSSFQFKNRTGDIADIAAQLKVANILEGSVRKSGNRVRITAQLVKADDGYHLWSETYDRTLENIFEVQDEIAVAVVDALKITLLGAAPVAVEVDPNAYALFLQGRYYSGQHTELSSQKAVEAYEKALDIDPEYADALAGLALTVSWRAGFGYIEYESGVARALAAARKAVELDAELALAWVSLSAVQGNYLWQWQDCYESAQKAIDLDPANSAAIAKAAEITRDLGQLDRSLGMFQKAVKLDPLNLTALKLLARAYSAVGRYEEAEQQFLGLLTLSPGYEQAHVQYAYDLLVQGRYQEALEQAEKEQEPLWRELHRIFALHSLGRQEESDAGLEAFIEAHSDFWAYQIAEVYAFRNETDKAFSWLEAALQYRDPGLSNLLSDRTLVNLHDDTRWEPFLNKVGLLEGWQAMPAKYKGARQ